MILVIGHATARIDSVEQMLRLSTEHVMRSRSEPGCLSHEVHRDVEQSLRLVFVERWSDEAALRTHFRLESSRRFARALADLAEGRPEMTVYKTRAFGVERLLFPAPAPAVSHPG